MSDTEIKVTAPDATAAADGEPHLQTTVTVTFADTEGSKIDSVPSAEGANEYTYNESATITQVDMYGGSSDPTIVVFGSGFGTEPSAVSPCMSGGEDFANDDLSFGDLTTLTGAGAVGDCIGLDVSTYTETEIEFTLGAGYSNYPVVAAGDQFTVDVYGAIYTGTVSWNVQTIQFTSSPPSPAVVGGKGYTPQATSSAGLEVAITVDHTSSTVCGITDGVVSFFAPGTCTLDANQPGGPPVPRSHTGAAVLHRGPADHGGHGQRDRNGERRSHLQRHRLGQRQPRPDLRARGRCPVLAVDQPHNRGHLGHGADQHHHLLLLGQGHQPGWSRHQLDPDGDGGPADHGGHGQRHRHGLWRGDLQRRRLG